MGIMNFIKAMIWRSAKQTNKICHTTMQQNHFIELRLGSATRVVPITFKDIFLLPNNINGHIWRQVGRKRDRKKERKNMANLKLDRHPVPKSKNYTHLDTQTIREKTESMREL